MRFIAFVFAFLALNSVAMPEEAAAPTAPAAVAPAPVEQPAVATPAPAAEPAVVATPDVVEPAPVAGDVVAPATSVTTKDVVTPDVKEAVPVPQTDDQAVEQTEQAIDAFGVGKYAVGVLLVLGVLIFVIRKLFPKTAAK